jgi:hypothetical protein
MVKLGCFMKFFETLCFQTFFFYNVVYFTILGMNVILLCECLLLPRAIAVIWCLSPWLWVDVGHRWF